MATLTHAQERAEERMRVTIGRYDEIEMIMQILKKENAVMEKLGSTRDREIWQVYYKDKVFRVVFDPEVLHSLITVGEQPRRNQLVPAMLQIVIRNRKQQRYFNI
jgi:hypothetical protein